MTRAEIRALARRQVNEVTADQWADSDINSAINVAYQLVQARFLVSDPLAFLRVDRAPLVASQHEYAWPLGMIHEIEVAVLNSSSGEYEVVEKADYSEIRGRSTGSSYQYAHHGRWLYLAPAPSASLAAGLQAIYVPTLSLSTDGSVPQIKQLYHHAIVLNTAILLIGETADDSKKIHEQLDLLYGSMVATNRQHAGAADRLKVQLVKGY